MAVARVEVDVERAEVERDVARNVRAVDNRFDPPFAGAATKLLDRKPERSLRGDLTEEEDARPVVDAAPDLLRSVVQRHRHGRPHVPRGGVGADVLPGEIQRAVLERGREHLVVSLERDRPRGEVHPGRRVRHEHEVVRICVDVRAERLAGTCEQAVDPP